MEYKGLADDPKDTDVSLSTEVTYDLAYNAQNPSRWGPLVQGKETLIKSVSSGHVNLSIFAESPIQLSPAHDSDPSGLVTAHAQYPVNIYGNNIAFSYQEVSDKDEQGQTSVDNLDFIIVVYNVGVASGLDWAKKFVEGQHRRNVMLVGTQIDRQDREVSYEVANLFAREHCIKFIEVSAIKGENIGNLTFIMLEHWLFGLFHGLAPSELTGKLGRLLHQYSRM